MKFFKVLLSLISLVSLSCSGEQRAADAPRMVKCEVAQLSSSGFEHSTFPGKVVAERDLRVGFRVAGIIEEIVVADGEKVAQGDVIARMDSRDYAIQLSATQAEYDAIKAEVDRIVSLYEDESVSANDYDKACNGLRAITAKLEAHKNALADTQLRAPIDGYVDKSYFDRGEAVAAGTPVVALISAAAPEIVIDIPAANYLRQGDFVSAEATIEIFKGVQFPLSLKSISPKANLNQLYKVTFTVEGDRTTLPSAGMSAMVKMSYSKSNVADVEIPFSAIVERDGESAVWVVEDGKVTSRKVEVKQIQSAGRAVILSGVECGDVVVAAGVNSLKEGQRVSILQESAASNIGGVK